MLIDSNAEQINTNTVIECMSVTRILSTRKATIQQRRIEFDSPVVTRADLMAADDQS